MTELSEEHELIAIERALSVLEGDGTYEEWVRQDGARLRQYVETFGALPLELDPVEPSPQIKDHLLSQVGAASGLPENVVDLDAVRAASRESAPAAVPATIPAVAAQGAPRSWMMGMAAALALCLLSLVFLAGRLAEQGETLQRMNFQLASYADPQAPFALEGHSFPPQAYSLTPVANAVHRVHEDIAGVVWLCLKHQMWRLNISGLPQPPTGQEYRFWYLTEDGMQDAGVVEVHADGGLAERAATGLPQQLIGFGLSLESKGRRLEVPEHGLVLKSSNCLHLSNKCTAQAHADLEL